MPEPASGSGTVCSPKACCLFTRPWGSVADMTPSVAPAVAHLSDPHLTTGALGAEPARGLHRALSRVLALDPRPTCVVITGDLTDHGRADEYAALRAVIGDFPLPLHLAVGNHDDREALSSAFSSSPHLSENGDTRYLAEYPELTVIVLDSLIPGSAKGKLGAEQLAWLDSALAQRPHVPVFVCVHHPPAPVGIPFLDGMGLDDGPALEEVVARHPNVVRVLSGHVHRPTVSAFGASLLTTAPSTYRQSGLVRSAKTPMGYVHEPTGFLLHQRTGRGWVTHTVQVSHTSGLIGHY
ncbi:phosphodiesterase [Nocardiopsis metallicus]